MPVTKNSHIKVLLSGYCNERLGLQTSIVYVNLIVAA